MWGRWAGGGGQNMCFCALGLWSALSQHDTHAWVPRVWDEPRSQDRKEDQIEKEKQASALRRATPPPHVGDQAALNGLPLCWAWMREACLG